MSASMVADAWAYLKQGMSIKDVAYTLGVSEWVIAKLFIERQQHVPGTYS